MPGDGVAPSIPAMLEAELTSDRSQFTSWPPWSAQMAELVDALLSGSSAARCAGSNPVLGTAYSLQNQYRMICRVFSFWVFHPPLFDSFYTKLCCANRKLV
jgi:hypothetical protein